MPANSVERCALFLKSKNAYCKFAKLKDSPYCAQHVESRIACPVDGSHSIDKKLVGKHLLVCPYLRIMARDCSQPFYGEDYALSKTQENYAAQLAEISLFAAREKEADQLSMPVIEKAIARYMPERLVKSNWNSIEETSPIDKSILADIDWDDLTILPLVQGALAPLLKIGHEMAGLDSNRTEGELEVKQIFAQNLDDLQSAVDLLGGTRRQNGVELTIDSLLENQARFKHQLQTLEMCARLRRFMGAGRFDQALRTGDWIDMGSGKGGLMRAVLALLDGTDCSKNSARYVLVERDRRRRVAERLDSRGQVTTKWDHRMLRLRIDIVDFDMGNFIQRIGSPRCKAIPWPLKLLTALYGAERFELTDEDSLSHAIRKVAASEKTGLETDKGDDAIREVLSDSIDDRPVNVIAKHLCGYGTTLALQATLRMVQEVRQDSIKRRESAAFLLMSPCCYHACAAEDYREVVELLQASESKVVRRLGDHIRGVVGWSTGADGQRMAIGRVIKDAILATRIKALVNGGAKRVQALRFCPTQVTKENTLLLAEFDFKPMDRV